MSLLRGRLARHLSPALIISVFALVIAGSTGAVAAIVITGKNIKNETVTSVDIKNGSLAMKDLNAKARTKTTEKSLWAFVAADGTLLRGNGVASVTYSTSGQYFITFDRSVLNSGIAVSAVSDGTGATQVNWRHCAPIPGSIAGCGGGGIGQDPASIFVNTEDSAGANVDRPFSVVVDPAGADFKPTLRMVPRAGTRGAEGR